MKQEAVLHFRDGQTLRCDLAEFPSEDAASIRASAESGEREVAVTELKAVFFLRGAAASPEPAALPAALTVEFADGEVIRGRAGSYNPSRSGFYLFPADRSKNERIFVVSSAIVSIDAETL